MMTQTEIQTRLAEAVLAEQEGELLDALKAYRDIYVASPHDQDAIVGLARTALALGEVEYAFDFFVKLLIENHQHPWGYWGRAAVYFTYHQRERAYREVCRALALDVPATSLHVDCAVLLNENGYYEEALQALSALDETDFDEDAEIEWCYAEIVLGNVREKTRSLLHRHGHRAENLSMWKLLDAMSFYHADRNKSLALIREVLREEPELQYRVEALGIEEA